MKPVIGDQAEDDDEQQDVAAELMGHTDFPAKRPVGLNSSTMIRIAKVTANL